MTPDERSARIEELFEQASGLPPEQRRDFLASAAGDDALAREVERLLTAEEQAGEFLGRSALGQSLAEEAITGSFATGRVLGAYQLRSKIGEGGTGAVFLATRADDQFRKRVAIKVVPLAMASAEHLRRFRTERHILASLDHPAIARLFDAGTSEEGMPYFVMEYIEGEPIDAYCDRHRLSIRERIRLFQEVCAAVQFAHQNLIVHRDLKPSNILVTGHGKAKLLDFGIAKLLNPELTSPSAQPTLTWHRVMTPDYASPEQIQGRTITTASDVYSLGVLLYELLTGRLPHELAGKTPQQIEQTVTAQDPVRPSTAFLDGEAEPVSAARRVKPSELRRQLAGDLDNIVLTALRQEPQRRYGSAEQLAEDLQRHLDGLPVRARQGTFIYRWGKRLRRHWPAFTTAAAFLALAVGFVVTVAVQSSRIAEERDQARHAAMRSEQVLSFMQEVFKEADPTESKGEAVTLREALDRGSEKVSAELEGQPEVQASLWYALGEIYFNLGAYDRALVLLESALTTRREMLGEDHPAVGEMLSMLGSTQHKLGDYDAAERLHRQALEISQRRLGENDPELIHQLNNLVAALGDKGRYEEAVPLARRALELTRAQPEGAGPELMNAMQNLAGLHFAQGDYEGTADWLHQALELQREQLGHKHPDVAFAMSSLGVVLYRQGAYEESRRMQEQALELQRQVIGPEHPDTARSQHNLAVLLGAMGEVESAERHLRDVLALRKRVLGADHPDVAYSLRGLGQLLVDHGSPAEAEPLLRECLRIWSAKLSPDNWQIASIRSLLGENLTALGRYAEAEPLLVESHPRLAEQLGADDPQTREAVERLVQLYTAWDQPEKAREFRSVLQE